MIGYKLAVCAGGPPAGARMAFRRGYTHETAAVFVYFPGEQSYLEKEEEEERGRSWRRRWERPWQSFDLSNKLCTAEGTVRPREARVFTIQDLRVMAKLRSNGRKFSFSIRARCVLYVYIWRVDLKVFFEKRRRG